MGTGHIYITARRLFDLYADKNGGPAQMLQLLAFHLRQRDIKARCHHRWTTQERSLVKALEEEPQKAKYEAKRRQKKIGKGAFVPRSLWMRSVDWQNDLHLWLISKNVFVVTIAPGKRVILNGMRFPSKEAYKLFGQNKKRKELKSLEEGWRRFWYEIIRLMQNGRTDFGRLTDSDLRTNEKLSFYFTEGPDDDQYAKLDEKIAEKIRSRLPIEASASRIRAEITALRKEFKISSASPPGTIQTNLNRI